MKYLSLLLFVPFLFAAESAYSQTLHHPKSGKALPPAALDGSPKVMQSFKIPKLNPNKMAGKFRMPIFNPKDVDAKILIVRPSGEYRYNMPNMLPKDTNRKAFKFDRDQKKE